MDLCGGLLTNLHDFKLELIIEQHELLRVLPKGLRLFLRLIVRQFVSLKLISQRSVITYIRPIVTEQIIQGLASLLADRITYDLFNTEYNVIVAFGARTKRTEQF